MYWAANLTGAQKLFAFVSTLALSSLLLILMTSNSLVKLLAVAVICLAIIFCGMSLALPTEARLFRLRKFSLYIALSASSIIVATQNVIHQTLVTILGSVWPDIMPKIDSHVSLSTVPVLVFLLTVIFIVNYFATDRTTMGMWNPSERSLFDDPSVQRRLRVVCNEIKHKMDVIDQETRWQHTHYIPPGG